MFFDYCLYIKKNCYVYSIYIPIHDSSKGRRYILPYYIGGQLLCLGGRYISVEIFGPMGALYFKGGQYISLSDPQYFARGTTYFGPNLKYTVRGTLLEGIKYSVTDPGSPKQGVPKIP